MVWMLVKNCSKVFGEEGKTVITPFDQLWQSRQQISGAIAVSSDNENNFDESLHWIELTSDAATSMDNFQAVNIWLWKCANMTVVRKWKLEGRSLIPASRFPAMTCPGDDVSRR